MKSSICSRNNLPFGIYLGSTMYDLDNDGYEELLNSSSCIGNKIMSGKIVL